ncbi:MAG: SDR family oxidoreductase [Deltaproteobacteria bacterium]|nr:SDR family oxidoreductase [Deltaproteobacteria bacterium]
MAEVNYSDRTVFITGGSSGIGLAAAKLLASRGAPVVIFARGEARLETAAAAIRECSPSLAQTCAWRQLDVTRDDDVLRTMIHAVDDFGAPRILINSAGFSYPDYFENITAEKFDETIRTNLHGTRNTIHALLPAMKVRGGNIVNISSLAGLVGIFGYTAYCAAKFAVIGFSESLRSEVKRHHITVSVLCPPDTDTPMLAEENRTKPPETRAIAGNAGVMTPEEVARVMIRGMEKGTFIIIPGLEGKLLYYARRFFPAIVDSVMDRAVRSVSRDEGRKDRSGTPSEK